MTLREALGRDFLIGDGAYGTRLAELGFDQFPYELACIFRPELVTRLHAEYAAAGADVIETHTFLANRIRFGFKDVDLNELNRTAARLARQAVGPDRFVLGAIGPSGKTMEPIGNVSQSEIAGSVTEQAQALLAGGVDGFLLETFIDIAELRVAVEAVRSLTDCPIIVTKAFIEDGETIADGLPFRVARAMVEMGADAVGANCVVGPQRMTDLVRQMREATILPILAYPTPGLPQLVKGQAVYDASPEYFGKAAARLVEEGATLVGGCCGTTPAHIKRLSEEVRSKPVRRVMRASTDRVSAAAEPLPQAESSRLSQRLQSGCFAYAVELDVPKGLILDKLLAAVSRLKAVGADVINISDGARARLRMNPAAVSAIIQSHAGIEVTMHFSCRDRNLLAIQSDLLGAHALGIRNILAVTGDPANIGDYPSATSVFDVDAIGLCRIMKRFNDGIDLAGNGVGMKCAFTIACAFNPLGDAQERDRLKRKVEAGAQLVYTQPVFHERGVDEGVRQCGALGVPCFVGVMPLRSARHAEFMHHEVPGIEVPDDVRKKLTAAENEAEALEIGMCEALRLAQHVGERAQGLYLMPPFGKSSVAERIIKAVRNR